MKIVPFFFNDIRVNVHTASADVGHLVGKTVSLEEFSQAVGGAPLSLLEGTVTGELLVKAKAIPGHPQPTKGEVFMEGAEAA